MAEIKTIFRRIEVQRLLSAIRDGIMKSIEPTFSYGEGVRYPACEEIMGVPAEAIEATLKELSQVGILVPEIRQSILVCPQCKIHQLMVQLSCPACASPDINKGPIVEHLACGHIDFEEKFKSDEEFVCPTCGKTLRTIGVDYRRPGTLYKCRNCNEIFPNPKKRYICSNGHSGDENELVLRNINVYKPNPAKHALIEREIIELGSILEELTAKGWHGQAPAMLRGKSGIVHTFTLALWAPESNPASERPDILADWCTAEVEVDSTMVLAFYAKTLDVTPRESLLFVIPRTGIEAKVLAESFNISIIEVEDLTELKGKARIQLLNMASTLQALKTALRKLD